MFLEEKSEDFSYQCCLMNANFLILIHLISIFYFIILLPDLDSENDNVVTDSLDLEWRSLSNNNM